MKTLPDTLPDSPDELQQILREREVFWLAQVSHWQDQYQSMVEQLLLARLTFSTGTNNPMQDLQLHMMSAFSQFERALLKGVQGE